MLSSVQSFLLAIDQLIIAAIEDKALKPCTKNQLFPLHSHSLKPLEHTLTHSPAAPFSETM